MVLLFLLSLKDHETKILGNSTARQTEAVQVGVRIEARRASSSLVPGQVTWRVWETNVLAVSYRGRLGLQHLWAVRLFYPSGSSVKYYEAWTPPRPRSGTKNLSWFFGPDRGLIFKHSMWLTLKPLLTFSPCYVGICLRKMARCVCVYVCVFRLTKLYP